MDARVALFHTTATDLRKAGAPARQKAAKEVKQLRSFLFKNQSYRFTERDKSHLFSAIEVCTVCAHTPHMYKRQDACTCTLPITAVLTLCTLLHLSIGVCGVFRLRRPRSTFD